MLSNSPVWKLSDRRRTGDYLKADILSAIELAEGQQGNDGQARRADGKPLGDRLDSVAGAVQLIGDAGRILIEPGSSNCQKLRLVRPGQEDICSEYSESPWFYEVAEIAMILALKDYDACYAALKKTRQVVTVLEAAREDAQLGF